MSVYTTPVRMSNKVDPAVPPAPNYSEALYTTTAQPQASGVYPAMPAQNVHPSMFMQQQQPQPQVMQIQLAGMKNPFAQDFPAYPFQTTCKACKETVTTDTEKKMGHFAKRMCCTLAFACACCCVPLCADWKDTVHSCPKCNAVLGRNVAGRQYRGSPGTFMQHPMA